MLLASLLAGGAFAQDAGDAGREQLDELIARVTQAETLAEADVSQVLEMALSEGRPHVVLPICKTYLAQNPNPSAAILKLIAENTRLAGDYRLAATRQKRLALALPEGSEEASNAAAVLYRMLKDMDAGRDAYGFMGLNGTSLRASMAARKFDEWYLSMAWENKDLPAVAKWLAACFADKAPLELERMLFWDGLDRLIAATRLDNPAAYKGLADMRTLAGLIRENPERAARLKLQSETLAFNAAARGKDAAALEISFAPVAAAAKAWFDAAPSGATLRSICEMWANDFERESWQQHWKRGEKGKQAFFKETFAKLSDAERVVVASRCASCATPATWLELVKASSPSPDRKRWVGAVPFETKLENPEAYRALAPKLAGVGGKGAAIVRSLAAGNDYYGCLKHLNEKECTYEWNLTSLGDTQRKLSAIYRSLPIEDVKRHHWDRSAGARCFVDAQLPSGLLPVMSPNDLQSKLSDVWSFGGQARFLQCLEALRSVPWSKAERATALSRSQGMFRSWSDNVRRQETAAAKDPEKKKRWDADVAMMAKLDAAFRVALDANSYDASKSPTPLAGHLAQLMRADSRKDQTAALAAGRKAYALVRDFGEKKLPFGQILFREILKGRGNVDMLDLQCEALADQLTRRATKQSSRDDLVQRSIIDAQGGLPGDDWRRMNNKAALSKVEAAVAKATLAMLEAGQFDATLFDLYRKMVSDNESSRRIFDRLVKDKVLAKHPEYLDGDTAATKYQWLLAHEFQWMNEKYPRDSYFDDMFAEEVARTGLADPFFWQHSSDKAHKGANAAAVALKGFAKLPFGYDGDKPVYGRGSFDAVVGHVLRHADAGPRGEMMAAAQAAFGKTRFDNLALPTVSGDRAQWFDRAKVRLDVAAKQPRLVPLPAFPAFLKDGKKVSDLTKEELSVLLRFWSVESRPLLGQQDGWKNQLVLRGLVAHGSDAEWLKAIPTLWMAVKRMSIHGNDPVNEALVKQAEAFAETKELQLAGTFSSAALTLGVPLRPERRARIEAVRAKALAAVGGVIPVDRLNERYPLYVAQMDYLAGKKDRAWFGYSKVAHLLPGEVTKMDPLFLVWVAGRSAKLGEHSVAENLVEVILKAVKAKQVQLPDAESRASLDLILADIALALEQYKTAGERYQRVAQAHEYALTRARIDAVIGGTEVLLRQENYDEAADRLEDMLRGNRNSYARSRGALQLARINLADGALQEAGEYLDEALQYSAGLPEAILLQGEVNLQRRKLQEASEVEISDATRLQKVLIPGKPLSVQMEDKNLTVVGGNVAIEVRVWTEKGDEEIFAITPFGDSKSKFRGYLPTALGKAVKHDNTLQVLGGDTVRYDYSERFKQSNAMRDTSWDVPELVIKSDSQMAASSGGFAMEAEGSTMRLIAKSAGVRSHGERRAGTNVKPGNPINVRVVDPDRSMTAEKDEVVLTAKAASGDRVRLVISETEPVSGVFGGALKTSLAPATATASDSSEGSDPVGVISGGDHAPWVARPDGKRPKTYDVDMNDNVELKSMTIQADVPARALKAFQVQISMDGRSFKTVGAWPKAASPWDGSLRMTIMPCARAQGFGAINDPVRRAAAIRRFMATEGAAAGKQVQIPATLATPHTGVDQRRILDSGVAQYTGRGGTQWFVAHVHGAFFLPERAQRTFRPAVSGKNAGGILLIDGRLAERDSKTGKVQLSASLAKGVHRLDLYMFARYQPSDPLRYNIEWDIPEAPYFATCSAEAFDVTKHPQIGAAVKFVPATVAARKGNTEFDVSFAEGTRARVVRLLLADFEGDAPALRKLTLHDLQDRRVLPTEMDLTALRENDVLETRPGDEVTITYEDPTPITASEELQTAELTVTYANARIQICNPVAEAVEINGQATSIARTTPIWRFRPGHTLYVLITDADADVSDQPDMVPFKVRTGSGRVVELEAIEARFKVDKSSREGSVVAEEHKNSGTFIAKFTPVEGEPQAEGEVPLLPNDDLSVVYLDKENVSPGIPWERIAQLQQAGAGLPEVYVYDLESAYRPEEAVAGPARKVEGSSEMLAELGDEFVPARRVIMGRRRESQTDAHTATGMVTVALPVEITWPAVLMSRSSRVAVFAQSYESRRLAGVTNQNEFSIDMPGTIVLAGVPGAASSVGAPPGYDSVSLRRVMVEAASGDGLGMGTFTCMIPLELGEPSTMTQADRAAILEERAAEEWEEDEDEPAADEDKLGVVMVRGTNDGVVVGIPYNPDLLAYENGDLGTNMIVRHYALRSDPFLDIMDLKYNRLVTSLYMGETVYLRVIDPAGDVSSEKDSVTVQVTVGGGDPVEVSLMETYPHSGVFKGLLEMATLGEAAESSRAGVVGADYGKDVVVAYTGGVPGETLERSFKIDMGSDGSVRGFTRVFKDPLIAMKTQFTTAESYFKLARSHRKVGMEEEAAKELAQGRKLLEEAIRDYPASEARAQAEYLLAELSLELGDASSDEAEAKAHHAEALQRFSDLVSSFPDSEYAPKAQFNKALMLEKIGQIDQACEEYVKLSYKYPGNPLVAETIARLGQYFITKSKEIAEELEVEEDEVRRKQLAWKLDDSYITAAEVFGRLSERFPKHRLATKALLLSGQAYIKAKDFKRSRKQFMAVINGDRSEKDLVAEAMYWCGDAYAKQGEQALLKKHPATTLLDAFRTWKRLTWDYPETPWATYARARLGDGEFMAAVKESQEEK
jgi:outer membrane protein assembly factor BamD (BamD/ComL family)